MISNVLEQSLSDLEGAELKRVLREVSSEQANEIIVQGRKVLNFCSNNYLGLANDPRLKQAAMDAAEESGVGSGASRLVCGHMTEHKKLEHALIDFKGTEAALVFSTGYMANVGIISSLFNRHDVIFSDRLNHASIVDGIQLSRATVHRYPHKDMKTLEDMLKSTDTNKRKCIITDGVFSMDGDLAPLDHVVELAKKYNSFVMVDDAHGLGVIGKDGKGTAEYFGVEKDIDIQMGTLSKAAGSLGGYCCGSKVLIDFLINKARSFIYTTGLPPMVAAASRRAIEIMGNESGLTCDVNDKAGFVRSALKDMGFDTLDSQTPIIPVLIKDNTLVLEFSKRLLDKSVLISAIRPPTVPAGTARLRVTVMATHEKKDLELLVGLMQSIGSDLNII